jgi:hypothetical protein
LLVKSGEGSCATGSDISTRAKGWIQQPVQNGASIELAHIIYEPLVRRGKDWKFSPWLA